MDLSDGTALEMQDRLETLRHSIGSEVSFHGLPCRVIEVLEDGPCLVLQALDTGEPGAGTEIQPDRFGDPHRRVPATYAVPVFGEDGNSPNPDFLALALPP